jgi:serine/threonine protein kinase
MNFKPGERINDYEILQVLGTGGMGEVYKVRNIISDRIEAMKVLLRSLGEAPELADRFLHEIRVLARLEHPNIAALRTALSVNDQVLMVMEFVEGVALDQKLRAGPIPIPEATGYMLQVLAALEYAHGLGVIHRDIKPPNVMVTAGGAVKLMDFGIAIASQNRSLTMTGQTVGSLYYMAPEQIRGEKLDSRSDLYSTGVTFYELVTGKRPYGGDSDYEIMSAHIGSAPVPPSEINRSIPARLGDAILRALEKDPEKRFQNAREFSEALKSASPGPPAATPGEFTKLFRTQPPPAAAPVPMAPSPVQRAEEFTRMFVVGGSQAAAPAPAVVAQAGVALVVSACQDPAWIGRRFEIRGFPFRIGGAGADLSLPFDRAVSRQHAIVNVVNGSFVIEDSASTNGTFVNGKQLRAGRPEPLLFGANILLGTNTQLTFVSMDLAELPDLNGALIGGRYMLEEKLQASAKSAVYRAADNKLPHSVMVKILSPALVRHSGYREQFEREANIASRLQHPNICRVLDFGDTELPDARRTVYITMEYLGGGSLSWRLAAGAAIEPSRVAVWLEKLAAGLQYVHEKGVVHGSIKPTAIVFDSNDNPYLTDFAIAVSATDQSHSTIIGSPPFLAPEQWESAELSPATDQYALAAMFYLILAGSHPYEGQENPSVRKRNFLLGPAPAHEMARQNGRTAVPASVSPILQRALSLRAENRFPSIADFAAALAGILAGRVSATPGRPFVFISYRRDSGSAWALLFRNELDREYGYEVFVDSEQRDTAGQFPRKLQRSIERCDVFVCLLAENTLESPWVNREIELAHQARKPMVPVFQESFRFPKEMDSLPEPVRELLLYDGVKLLDRQNIYVPAAIRSLSEAIRQLLV